MALHTVLLTVVLAVSVPVLVILVGAVRWLLKIRKIGKQVDLIPGPKRNFFMGNLSQIPMPSEEQLRWQVALCEEYKTSISVWFGPFRPIVALCHPSTVKKIQRTAEPKLFSGGGGYSLLLDWLGHGLLLNGGPGWFRNRRLLTPAFHFDVLKPYIGIYNEAIDIFLDKMAKSSDPSTNPSRSVEIYSPVSLCTLDIMLRCAFSFQDDIQGQGANNPYVKNVSLMAGLVVKRAFNPLLYWDKLYALTANGKNWADCCDYAHQVAHDITTKRRKQLGDKTAEEITCRRAMDFLDILLLARDEAGEGLTDTEIRQEVDTFLFAGHDTTASAISWCLYNLASHPEYQTKAREEVDALFEGRQSDHIQWEDLGKLPYLTMCIKESLRHTPPVPIVSRELTQPLEIDGVTLEPGTFIDIVIWGVHHNPYVWGEDHMEYRPQRFSHENMKTMDSHAFIPFSAGPRNCIGQNFAMNELKTIVARVLHRFTLEADPDHSPQRLPELVMRAKDGIRLLFTPRSEKREP